MSVRTGTIAAGALHDQRRGLIGWVLAVAVVATMYTAFYPSIGAAKFSVMLDAMPEFAKVMGFDKILSASGYVGATVYSLLGAVLVLVCAISLGARLIAGDEEAGILELDFSAPVTRDRVFLERLAVLWLTVLMLVLSITTTLLILSSALDLGLEPAKLIAASTGLLLFGGAMGTVAFGVGAATGRRGIGIGVASSLAVVAYLFNYLSPLIDAPWMESFSPFSWYIGNDPLLYGFDGGGLALLAALAIVAGVGGWVPFRRRNLMV